MFVAVSLVILLIFVILQSMVIESLEERIKNLEETTNKLANGLEEVMNNVYDTDEG